MQPYHRYSEKLCVSYISKPCKILIEKVSKKQHKHEWYNNTGFLFIMRDIYSGKNG